MDPLAPYLMRSGVPDHVVLLTSMTCREAFRRDPSKVWQFYHYRRSVVLSAAPNAAHMALASLLLSSKTSQNSLFDRIMPNAKSFHLITQNVDGLSGRALEEVESVSTVQSSALDAARNSILEMHGNLFKTICTKCGDSRIDSRHLCVKD